MGAKVAQKREKKSFLNIALMKEVYTKYANSQLNARFHGLGAMCIRTLKHHMWIKLKLVKKK